MATLQISLIFSLFSVVLSSLSMSFSAYQMTKSSSSSSFSFDADVTYESASSFLPSLPCGISFTVTRKPASMAFLPFLMAMAVPGPIRCPGFWSESGIQHSVAVVLCLPKRDFSIWKWPSVHAAPRAATAFSMPTDCSVIASGAPSTQYILFSWIAFLRAMSRPKMFVPLWKMKESLLLMYLAVSASSCIVLAVKATTRPNLSVIGIMILSRKTSM